MGQTPGQFKSLCQIRGHEKVQTTFYSYGEVGNLRQGEIIMELAQPQNNVTPDVAKLAKAIAQEMRQSEHTG